MRNPNGLSIKEKEEMQDRLMDMNEEWKDWPRGKWIALPEGTEAGCEKCKHLVSDGYWQVAGCHFCADCFKQPTPENCRQAARDTELLRITDNPATIFYGPHECPNGCGATICRASQEQGGMMFLYPKGTIYPNTNWVQHVCAVKDETLSEDLCKMTKFPSPSTTESQ